MTLHKKLEQQPFSSMRQAMTVNKMWLCVKKRLKSICCLNCVQIIKMQKSSDYTDMSPEAKTANQKVDRFDQYFSEIEMFSLCLSFGGISNLQ